MRGIILASWVLAVGLGGPAVASDRGEVNAPDTLRDAALAPFEDLNLEQTKIPEVLNRARADPYDLAGLGRCEAIAGEVGRLDGALGPDLDETPPPDRRSRTARVVDEARHLGINEVRDQTRHLLPFRGWIRQLTGAAKHDKKLAAAIRAGEVRRGYLKGVGMRMNCAPPAAPSWFVPKPREESASAPSITSLWEHFLVWLRGLLALIG